MKSNGCRQLLICLTGWVLLAGTAHAKLSATSGAAEPPLIGGKVVSTPPAQAGPSKATLEKIIQNPHAPVQIRQFFAGILTLREALAAHDGDYGAAHEQLLRAYRGGHAKAALALGLLYALTPYGGKQGDERAIEWMTHAADQGVVGAVPSLIGLSRARAYRGHPKALVQWWHWLKVGAADGMESEELTLARAYANGHLGESVGKAKQVPGLSREPLKAAYWFRKAVPGADWMQLDRIADRFQNGYGVPQELDEAVRVYKLEGATGLDSGEGYNNAAALLASCPLLKESRRHEAVRMAKRALAKASDARQGTSDPSWVAAIEDTLAMAYAHDGDYAKAVSTERKAIKLLGEAHGQADGSGAASRFKRRLALYRDSRPWLDPDKCREPRSRSAFSRTP